jgi:deoxyribonuclease IV
MQKIGFHVSIGGSISNSIKNAESIGCTAFQIFTRNPRIWRTKSLEVKDIEEYKRMIKESYIDKNYVVVHMPYLPNLAAPNNDFYLKSKEVFADEIIRCYLLDISYIILHLGSHLGNGINNGILQIVNACNFPIDNFEKYYRRHLPVNILLEKLNNKKFGVCLDTCHAFASWYDLRTPEKVIETINNFNDTINIKKLKVLHLNDSKGKINEIKIDMNISDWVQ